VDDPVAVVMQVILVALLAWGAWLSIFARDRRVGGDRRSGVRGGRRRGEVAPQAAPVRAEAAAPANLGRAVLN
jgi:hypothetical protein